MALSDLSYKLYTDSNLTIAFGGSYSLIHNTSLSDNPQDFVLYFGSPTADRTLEAVSNPGVDNITLTPTDTLPSWVANTAYTLGQSVEPTVQNGLRYEVTTAGTSHASTQPTWPTTPVGATVSDGTVTWTLRGASHQPTEIKLALTSGGLSSAVAGDPLILGTTLQSGVANAIEINIRVTNAVTVVSNNSGTPEIALYINSVQELSE